MWAWATPWATAWSALRSATACRRAGPAPPLVRRLARLVALRWGAPRGWARPARGGAARPRAPWADGEGVHAAPEPETGGGIDSDGGVGRVAAARCGSPVGAFGGLLQVVTLDLSHNILERPLPDAIGGMQSLQQLPPRVVRVGEERAPEAAKLVAHGQLGAGAALARELARHKELQQRAHVPALLALQ